MRTKEDNVKIHFEKRCKERLGYVQTQTFFKKLLKSKDPSLVFVGRSSRMQTYYQYTCPEGRKFFLVYNKSIHLFITIMPENWRDPFVDESSERFKKLYMENRMYAVRICMEKGMSWEEAHEFLERL